MGIKGLCIYLRKVVPEFEVIVPLSSFSGQRLAIDTSVYLYKYICMDNQLKGQWVDLFIKFIVGLRKHNIRPVFIFDGEAPKQKERTQKVRRVGRDKIDQQILELDELLTALNDIDYDEKLSDTLQARINNVINTDTSTWSKKEIMIELNNKFKKENSKAIHIGKEEITKLQDLLTALGLPWFTAAGEAERACSWLCKWGYVKGVVTTDSDVLAYGAPLYIQDIQVNQDSCKIVCYQDILDSLKVNNEQFLDFCIMCGTDYNDRIPGIGPVNALALIMQNKNLDGISSGTIDTSTLYYQEVRGLFTLPPKNKPKLVIEGCTKKKFRIPPMKPISKGNLLMLLIQTNSNYSIGEIEHYIFRPRFIVIS